MRAHDRLRRELLRLPAMEERPSRWGADPAFWVDGREIVHCHGAEAEVRVTRSLVTQALSDSRVIRRTRTSDWVKVPVAETGLVVRLAEDAILANRRELQRRTARRTRQLG